MNEPSKGKRGWRILRRILVGLAIFATLIAIFYTEEDWRGKRAWENCKRDYEAKGMVMDWDKLIPPPVPDDQNFFTASSNILWRFKKSTDTEYETNSWFRQSPWLRIDYRTNIFPQYDTVKTPLVVAYLIVSSSVNANSNTDTNALVVTLDDPQARERIGDLIRRTIGPSINGAAGFEFSELQFSNISPAQIYVNGAASPSIQDLESIVPTGEVTNLGALRIVATGDKQVFELLLSGHPVTAAADYLKWSDQFEPALDEVRAALKRPYAVLPGEYSQAYMIPIPNFITMRAVVQMLAQRAQCEFLLGQPDKALNELTLVHDLCRILEKPPTGKPETLVEAMINVAITGLYVNTIAEGFQRQVWQEPQLSALQEQLKGIDLPPWVQESFREQPAFTYCDLETTPADKFADMMSGRGYSSGNISIWKRFQDGLYLFLRFAPRGWIYQNIVNTVVLESKPLDCFDQEHEIILPGPCDEFARNIDKTFDHTRPFKIIAAILIPNITKATQVTAYNQTLVNEAQIACALERYHLAYGEYPETLDALVPEFIQKLPHDIIGGQPLHYRRKDDGKFLLYSIGWNEKDDDGQQSPPAKNGGVDYNKGDWVWEN